MVRSTRRHSRGPYAAGTGATLSSRRKPHGNVPQDPGFDFESLKNFFGLLAGLGAFSYVIGFIVVQSYFISYGMIPVMLLNSQYFAAGGSFLAIIVLISLGFFSRPKAFPSPASVWARANGIASGDAKTKREKFLATLPVPVTPSQKAFVANAERSYLPGYWFGFILCFSIIWSMNWLRSSLPFSLGAALVMLPIFKLSSSNFQVFLSLSFYLWIVLITLVVALVRDWTKGTRNPQFMAIILLVSLICLLLYGQYVYPFLSPSIGGAAPSRVKFLLDPKAPSQARSLLALPAGDLLSPPMQLATETSDSFVVINRAAGGSRRLFSFDKSWVSAVLYERPS